jgi:hypothetical protein
MVGDGWCWMVGGRSAPASPLAIHPLRRNGLQRCRWSLVQWLRGRCSHCHQHVARVLLSLTGSIAVAPEAVPQLWKLVKHDARQVRGLLARVLPFLRKSDTVHAGTATGTVAFGGVATGTASGKVTHNGSTEEQVEQIWRELDAVREDLGRLRTETTVRAKAIEKTVKDLRQRNSEWHQDLLRRIEQAEEEQTEFNARALPLIGFGIVLTAAASWLAERPLWVNVVAIAAVLALSIRVLGPIVRRGWRRWQDKCRLAPAEPA